MHTVTDLQKKQFAAIYLLEYMINAPKAFNVLLERNESDLEPILEWLLTRELVEIKDQATYQPTQRGRDALVRFMARYSDFLSYFDVFCAVDLGEGSFAFADYYEIQDETAWKNYLAQDRWEDLRVAVATYKKIDPVEIVFMSFLSEGRFGRDASGWQFDLLLGTVWDEILTICNTALHADALGYESEDGPVSGISVLKDVISQGLALAEQLHLAADSDDPRGQLQHPDADSPSSSTVAAVNLMRRRANTFDDSPRPPKEWEEPWEL